MKRLTGLLVLVALVLVACGGSSSDGSAPEANSSATEETTSASAESTEPVSEEAPDAPAPATATEAASGRTVIITPNPQDELAVPTGGWSTDFTRHTVALDSILSGGPGKDGIPAIDSPTFDTVENAGAYLEAREPVIEVEIDGEARAYPIRILTWHEIVNDSVGPVPISVTFCPLCNAAIVFDRRLGGQVLDFGTTGNLRNSDLIMYDRQTETWWQQFGGEGIVGELAGELLTQIPAAVVAWEDFATRHPNGTVLSQNTGFGRPYGSNPYGGYDTIDQPPFFPVENLDDDRLNPKERVVLIARADESVAVSFAALEAAGAIDVEIGDETLSVEWVPGVRSALDSRSIAEGAERGSARVTNADGELVPYDTPFWFAVAAFRPDAQIVR